MMLSIQPDRTGTERPPGFGETPSRFVPTDLMGHRLRVPQPSSRPRISVEVVAKRSFDLLNLDKIATDGGVDCLKILFEESIDEYTRAFYVIEVTHP